MVKVYFQQKNKKLPYVDIEDFIKTFLKLHIEYADFAEEDDSKVGFLANGDTPILISREGKVIPFVFPNNTIVLDNSLNVKSQTGKRRFTMAHEAAHFILERVRLTSNQARFHSEFQGEREYSIDELGDIFAAEEWQADVMAAALLMPKFIMANAYRHFTNCKPIKVYGDNLFAEDEKALIHKMAEALGVSFTALVIRMRKFNMLEYHNLAEYIVGELQFGGDM